MIFRSTAIRSVFVVAALLTASHARAECITLTANFVMQEKVFELVFSGVVVDITRTGDLGYRATFEVDRVWKGVVPKRVDLYVWELAPEIPRFETGHHYMALAGRLVDPRARAGAGLGASDVVAFTPAQCSGALAPDISRELGAGKPPGN